MPLVNRSGPTRDLVFISYSHADKIWLERLRIFLKPFIRQNVQVWLDPYIEVGDDWRREIAMALSRSSVGVLLVSGDFLASDFICDEELPALLKGADVGEITIVPVPVSASGYRETELARFQFAHPPDQPLDGLPEDQRSAALVKIAEQIAAAARKTSDLAPRAAAQPERVVAPAIGATTATGHLAGLHGVPPQRPNYLRRQEYLDRLKQALLGGSEQAVGITGAKAQGVRVGLHGMGGIGKTELAINLVNEEEVQRAFPDGIYRLTLGQTIEPLLLQGELAGYVAGETKVYATTNQGRDGLRQLLDGKSCLLVLDDLWRLQDAEPFDVLGLRSRLLVTTRDADLLVALGARELPLGVLSEELALELLASWAGQQRAALPAPASKVAANCGYLPLALALAGARVAGGAQWEEVASALERGRLEFLDHPYGSVFSSLRLSTDALPKAERSRYFELAVFPEDAQVPVEAICTLWRHSGSMQPQAARDLLLRLHRRALLTRSEDGRRVSFHDLQHDFLRLNIPSLVEVHAALVGGYRAAAPKGWSNGPDDGYFFQHLPQHFFAGDRLAELKALLCNYDWLAAKLRATNINALLADYDLVGSDPDLTPIGQALRLSIPALARDPLHLAGQLLGRLHGGDNPAIKTLVAGAEKGPGRTWLYPRFSSLTPPGGSLRQILVGHRNHVVAVAFVSDGSRALSGSLDGTLRLWDLATGETLRTLEGHSNGVSAVAVSADGRRALSGSADHTLRLWDLATGATLRTLKGHSNAVSAVAVLADGRRALSGSNDNTLRLWDLATGATLRTLEGHANWVRAVAVLADGSHALSGSADHTLRLWDLTTGEALRTLEGHTDGINAVAVLADGRRALSGSADKTLRLWDLATGATLRTLEGHSSWVSAVALLADGRRALSGSYDRILRWWDLATGATLRTLEGHSSWVSAVALSADGGRALSGSADHTLQLWDLATGATLRTLEGHRDWMNAVAVLADGHRALSGSDDHTLRLWDLVTGETLRTLEGHSNWVTAVAMFADGSRALSGSLDGTLRLWDLATGATLRTLEGHGNGVSAVALSADGRRALSGSADHTLRLWDLATGATLRTLKGHSNAVSAVAVQAGDNLALSGSYDHTLRLWDLETGATLRTLEGHSNWVRAVAVQAGDNLALSGSDDHTLRLWDLATGATLAEFTAGAAIICVAFAREDLIVAGSADGSIHILEIRES
jgi:WD40 repeat protein